jgi:hypothetical protein
VALRRITELGLGNLQERPERTRPSGVNSFNLENPDPAAIFEALKAAGCHIIFLRETGEIAPAFPEGGVPHLTAVRDWSHSRRIYDLLHAHLPRIDKR